MTSRPAKSGKRTDSAVREYLAWVIRIGHAHAPFEKAVARMPGRLQGTKPRGLPYSPWMLLEHMRLSQWDMLDFSRNPKYVEQKWPDDYWPKDPKPPSDAAWNRSVKTFLRDRKEMEELALDPNTDLYAKIPWGQGQTIFKEALQIADHNAYHIGQLIVVRRLLGAWTD